VALLGGQPAVLYGQTGVDLRVLCGRKALDGGELPEPAEAQAAGGSFDNLADAGRLGPHQCERAASFESRLRLDTGGLRMHSEDSLAMVDEAAVRV